MHHTLLYISLPSLDDYDVKMPHFTINGNVNKRLRSFRSLSKLEYGRQEINSKEIRVGINATKFEKTRIHFKSDFFAAVAVVDAKRSLLSWRGGGGMSIRQGAFITERHLIRGKLNVF